MATWWSASPPAAARRTCMGSLEYAQSIGAFTIGLSCNRDSQIATRCDLSITPVVGPEVVSGSTRMKAGTATKMVLNMLSTGAMIRLGKTYGNLMVDLRASNTKLADRARRIVRAVTNLVGARIGATAARLRRRSENGDRQPLHGLFAGRSAAAARRPRMGICERPSKAISTSNNASARIDAPCRATTGVAKSASEIGGRRIVSGCRYGRHEDGGLARRSRRHRTTDRVLGRGRSTRPAIRFSVGFAEATRAIGERDRASRATRPARLLSACRG